MTEDQIKTLEKLKANDKHPERGEIRLIGAGVSNCFFSRWSPDGYCERWYKNGQLEERYTVDENGKKEGFYESWHKNGQQQRHCIYKNGKVHGLSETWYPNGQQETYIQFSNGEINCVYQSWNQEGVLIEDIYYDEGLPMGRLPREVEETPKRIKVQEPKKKGGIKP